MIQKAFELMEQFLDGQVDPLVFSYDLPGLLYDEYEKMENEDPGLTEELNRDLPEICAEYERGADPTPLRKEIKREYLRLQQCRAQRASNDQIVQSVTEGISRAVQQATHGTHEAG